MPADYSAINTTKSGFLQIIPTGNNVIVLPRNVNRRGLYIRNVSNQAAAGGNATALVFLSFNINQVCVPWQAKLLEPGELYNNNWLDMYLGPVTIAVLDGPAAVLIEESE